MIRIESEPWAAMVAHARASYPNECCGAMLGTTDGESKVVRESIALQNAFEGAQAARYEFRPEDLLAADKAARETKYGPDRYLPLASRLRRILLRNRFTEFLPVVFLVVLSIQKGEFDHANSWLPNFDQTEAAKEELTY